MAQFQIPTDIPALDGSSSTPADAPPEQKLAAVEVPAISNADEYGLLPGHFDVHCVMSKRSVSNAPDSYQVKLRSGELQTVSQRWMSQYILTFYSITYHYIFTSGLTSPPQNPPFRPGGPRPVPFRPRPSTPGRLRRAQTAHERYPQFHDIFPRFTGKPPVVYNIEQRRRLIWFRFAEDEALQTLYPGT